MTKYLLDTNIYIAALRDAARNDELARFFDAYRIAVYQHSTVALEILSGAQTTADSEAFLEKWVTPFERVRRIVAPSHNAMVRAAFILTRLVEKKAISPGGFQPSFLNDCIIAASAREHGFTVVTGNVAEFTRIASVESSLAFTSVLPS